MVANDNFWAAGKVRKSRNTQDRAVRDAAASWGYCRRPANKPLITDTLRDKLLCNQSATGKHLPVVRIYMRAGPCTWLLSYIDPHDKDLAYGLVDLGTCAPFLSLISLPRLEETCDPLGFPLKADINYSGDLPLSDLALLAGEGQHL